MLAIQTKEKQVLTLARPSYAEKPVSPPKAISTQGEPVGVNPVIIRETAKLPNFDAKLKACFDAYTNLNNAEKQLTTAEDFYLDKYKALGDKIIEAKAVYFIDNGKKLSDQSFADAFNTTYDQKVSRVVVMRAKNLAEKWEQLDRTRRLCLIRGEDWKEALKYDRDTIKSDKEKAGKNSDEHDDTPAGDKAVTIKGMDTFDVFDQAIARLQAEKESINDIAEVFLSCLTSDEGKYSLKQVDNALKKAFTRLAE